MPRTYKTVWHIWINVGEQNTEIFAFYISERNGQQQPQTVVDHANIDKLMINKTMENVGIVLQ